MSLIITSSRKPPRTVRSFMKDLAYIFSGIRVTRGKKSIEELLSSLKEDQRLIIVDSIKGNPSRLRVFEKEGKVRQIIIRGVKLLRYFNEKPKIKGELKVLVNNEIAKKFAEILNLKTVENEKGLNSLIIIEEVTVKNKKLYGIFIKDYKNDKKYGPFFKITKIIE